MEELLTQEEQNIIIRKANSLWYKHYRIRDFPSAGKLGISKISDRGLICIYGNDDTGLQHIKNRHDRNLDGGIWRENQNKIVLDKPSRFSNYIELDLLLNIGDEIFSKEKSENRRPEEFEVYKGASNLKGESREYILIIYRGTTIIHSLFPTDKIYSVKKRKLNYMKSLPEIERYSNRRVAKISYSDKNSIVRYKIVLVAHYKIDLL